MAIDFTYNVSLKLHQLILKNKYKDVVFIADSNTWKYCSSELETHFPNPKCLLLPPGDGSKVMGCVENIMESLLNHQLDRNCCIIALGGGMVCDIAGFVASIYKRGIDCIYIPTSLLCMVDACYGGKTGINFRYVKNVIGTFKEPKHIFINTLFLRTLPSNEMASGFGEIIKYALISESKIWKKIMGLNVNNIPLETLDEIIKESLQIKSEIVEKDPFENGERKALNFGHTLGHALESLFNEKKKPITHGEAVAYGIICENYLSKHKFGYSNVAFNEVNDTIRLNFLPITIEEQDIERLFFYMYHDKKNIQGEIKFVSLQHPGKVLYDVSFSDFEIIDAIQYLQKFWL